MGQGEVGTSEVEAMKPWGKLAEGIELGYRVRSDSFFAELKRRRF